MVLNVTTGAEDNLRIQRAIIGGSKAYQTLRSDLKRGCILPPLVLAVSSIDLPTGLTREALDDVSKLEHYHYKLRQH